MEQTQFNLIGTLKAKGILNNEEVKYLHVGCATEVDAIRAEETRERLAASVGAGAVSTEQVNAIVKAAVEKAVADALSNIGKG